MYRGPPRFTRTDPLFPSPTRSRSPGEKTGGRIVNIASRAAYRGDSPAHWHYAASKSGMVAMTKTIARAYAKDGILAFAICPGFTMTGMADEYLASRGGDKLLADITLGRDAMPDEVGEMARGCAMADLKSTPLNSRH